MSSRTFAPRRLRRRRPSGLRESRAAMARLGRAVRRHRMAQHGHASGATRAPAACARAAPISVSSRRDARRRCSIARTSRSARWDALTQRRRGRGARRCRCACARRAWKDDERNGYRADWFVRIPVVRGFLPHVRDASSRSTRPLAGDAGCGCRADRHRALKAGRVYTGIDALASPPAFEFMLRRQRAHGSEGSVRLRCRSRWSRA